MSTGRLWEQLMQFEKDPSPVGSLIKGFRKEKKFLTETLQLRIHPSHPYYQDHINLLLESFESMESAKNKLNDLYQDPRLRSRITLKTLTFYEKTLVLMYEEIQIKIAARFKYLKEAPVVSFLLGLHAPKALHPHKMTRPTGSEPQESKNVDKPVVPALTAFAANSIYDPNVLREILGFAFAPEKIAPITEAAGKTLSEIEDKKEEKKAQPLDRSIKDEEGDEEVEAEADHSPKHFKLSL